MKKSASNEADNFACALAAEHQCFVEVTLRWGWNQHSTIQVDGREEKYRRETVTPND